MSEEQINMDAILDAALDELDDDDDNNKEQEQNVRLNLLKEPQHSTCERTEHPPVLHQPAKNKTKSRATTTTPDLDRDELEHLNNMMNEIMSATNTSGSHTDALGQVMSKLQEQIALEMGQLGDKEIDAATLSDTDETNRQQKEEVVKPVPAKPHRPVFGPEPPPPRSSEVDRTISNLLQGMAASAMNDDVDDDHDDTDIDEMMKQFENLGGDDMIDGMMQQLLKKDLMYEPIKDVTARFPKWLQDNKETLTDEEYTNRCLQYKKLQDLVAAYDTEPENSEKIFAYMKEVQEFGLPPSDIVADVAPDLTLDQDGIPQFEGMPDCNVM